MATSVNPNGARTAEEVRAAYLRAAGRWAGCDWPTRFGSAGLNLEGLDSRQATLLARATAGAESANWHAAARWLRQVEEDARAARQEAGQAVERAEAGQLAVALAHASQACALEAAYRAPVVWRPLTELLEAALSADEPSGPTGARHASDDRRAPRRDDRTAEGREPAHAPGGAAAARSP
jgi:hypothetical protein